MATRFCNLDAVSDGGGTTWLDAFNSFASLVAAWSSGDIAFIGGTSSLQFAIDQPSVDIIGVNSSGIEDGTRFIIDGITGDGLTTDTSRADIRLRNMEVKNCTGDGVQALGSSLRWYVRNVLCHDNTGYGWAPNLGDSTFQGSKFYSNGLSGIWLTNGSKVERCQAYLNSQHGFFSASTMRFHSCASYRNSVNGFHLLGANNETIGCVSENNGAAGINFTGVANLILYCRITNNLTGIKMLAGDEAKYGNNFLLGNTTLLDISTGILYDMGGNVTSGTEGYTDKANDDYTLDVAATNRLIQYYLGDSTNLNFIWMSSGLLPAEPITITAPGIPTGVTATALTLTTIKITWDFVSTATKFDIYRAPTSGGTFVLVGNDVVASSFTDTVTASAEFFYKVKAVNGIGESGFSEEVSAVTPTFADSVRTLLRKAVKFNIQQIIKNNDSGDGYIYKNTFRDFGDPNKSLEQMKQLPYVGIDFGPERNSNIGRGQEGDGNQAKLLNSVILEFTCIAREANVVNIPLKQEGMLNDLQARFGNNFGVPDSAGVHRAFNSLYLNSQQFGLRTNSANANCGITVNFTVWYRQQLTNPNNQV